MFAVEVLGGLVDAVERFEQLEVIVGGENADGVHQIGVGGVMLRNSIN